MKRTFKSLMVACGLAGLVSISAVTGVSAGGRDGNPVKAVTHSSQHADTTDATGSCTTASPGGPVWAYDNLSLQLSAVPLANGNWSVTITAHGSFRAFANPRTGDCYTGTGSVDGWLNYEVSSTTAPDPSKVPAQVSGELGQGVILSMFFDGHSTIVGGGHYDYSYTMIDGSVYSQVG